MTKEPPWKTRLAGLAASTGIRSWMSTLDYRACFYDQALDARYGSEQPRIYVFWHEYILIPLYLRGHCDLAMLLSRHRDADILARVAFHMGFDCVRGSTSRGSISALMEMARLGGNMHLTITPDGPRGPRRQLAQGAVFLASRLGLPIVPLGLGYNRPWRAKSWDHFAIPRPFSRARGIMGPAIHISPDLSRDALEECRLRVERLLTDLTVAAETWAESGLRKKEEIVVRPQSKVLLPREPAGQSPGKLTLLGTDDEAAA